jgi:hypothetical protein
MLLKTKEAVAASIAILRQCHILSRIIITSVGEAACIDLHPNSDAVRERGDAFAEVRNSQ